MGNAFSNPYVFRRAVALLHYKEHPLSGGPGDLGLFWRTFFCTRMTAEEHNFFWTAEDVRLLRLYHPDRLAAILLASIQQIDAFLALTCAAGPEDDNYNEDFGENLPDLGTTALRVGEQTDYMQPEARSSKLKTESGALPLDFTALINSLWLISGALPYCLEDIDVLKALLREDARNEANGNSMVITSQRTRMLIGEGERTESPFAADFAYHFFFRGDTCKATETLTDDDDLAEDAFFHPSSLGAQLVELLIKLCFVPGFTTTTAAAPPRRPTATPYPEEQQTQDLSEINFEDDLKLLVGLDCVPPSFLLRLLPSSAGISNDGTLLTKENNNAARSLSPTATSNKTMMMMSPLNENYRAIVLRTLLLTLSGFIFIPPSKSEDIGVEHDLKHECSRSRQRKTALMMTDALFNGQQRSLSALLCVTLLHAVRCYPKRHLTSAVSFFAWMRGNSLTSDHVDVISHALSILAMGIYSGSNVLSSSSVHVKLSECTSNVFLQVMKAALSPSALPSQSVQGAGVPSSYVHSLVEGLLILLESPLKTSVVKTHAAAIPSAPLVLHLLLWVMQQSPIALNLIGGRAETLMALVHNLLVSSTISTSRFGEGQLTLLCLLILARDPSFLQLLATPLPSVHSGATKDEAQKFLSTLRAAMPMLPQKLIILDIDTSEDIIEPSVDLDTLCLRTYGNVLVLALCYVISPSSPRWFWPLYRSAVEVLHTLQVCFSRVSSTQEMSFPCHVLNPYVLLELASGLDYLCSFRVLRLGVEVQRACLQMIRVVLAIIQSSICSVPKEGYFLQKSSNQRVTQARGSEIVPLLCALSMQRGLFNLSQLIYTTEKDKPKDNREVLSPNPNNADVILVEKFAGANPMTLEDENNMENLTDREITSHSINTSCVPAMISGFTTSLASCGEFEILYQITALVRSKMITQSACLGEESRITFEERSEKEKRCTAEMLSIGVSPSYLLQGHGNKVDFELQEFLLRDVTKVLNNTRSYECHKSERNEGRSDKGEGITTPTIRRVVVDGSSSGVHWLLAQLWRQIHMFNLSPPIFDYRSSVLVE